MSKTQLYLKKKTIHKMKTIKITNQNLVRYMVEKE